MDWHLVHHAATAIQEQANREELIRNVLLSQQANSSFGRNSGTSSYSIFGSTDTSRTAEPLRAPLPPHFAALEELRASSSHFAGINNGPVQAPLLEERILSRPDTVAALQEFNTSSSTVARSLGPSSLDPPGRVAAMPSQQTETVHRSSLPPKKRISVAAKTPTKNMLQSQLGLPAASGNSSFPLPALPSSNSNQARLKSPECDISLESFQSCWDKCRHKEEFLRKLHEGRIPILKDTSVTGRWSTDNHVETKKHDETKKQAPHVPAEFLHQLVRILENEEYSNIITWTDGILSIHKPSTLEKEVLAAHFGHANLCSFQRQLNYFGFYRSNCQNSKSSMCYTNEAPTTSDIKSLLKLKRKNPRKILAARKKRMAENTASATSSAHNFALGNPLATRQSTLVPVGFSSYDEKMTPSDTNGPLQPQAYYPQQTQLEQVQAFLHQRPFAGSSLPPFHGAWPR